MQSTIFIHSNTVLALSIIDLFNIHAQKFIFYARSSLSYSTAMKTKQNKTQSTCCQGTYVLVRELENIWIINMQYNFSCS